MKNELNHGSYREPNEFDPVYNFGIAQHLVERIQQEVEFKKHKLLLNESKIRFHTLTRQMKAPECLHLLYL